MFEIFSKNEIRDRFDKSDEFWQFFGVHMPENQKVLGLYEVESINDQCLVTLAVNPKEYYEYFKSHNVNKKHKGIKKGSAGMEYANYAKRIKPLFNFESYQKPKNEEKPVIRISVKKGELTTHKIMKSKFSQLNDKRFYFPNAIISLPFGHEALSEIDKFKKNQGQRIEQYFLQSRNELLDLEKKALKKCSRLNILDEILMQPFKVVHNDNVETYLYNSNEQSVLDFVLEQGWTKYLENTHTTEPLMETY